jgi:hypothetical protein
MSLYGAVFPDDLRAQRIGMLLACIGEPRDLLINLRLRDAWVEHDDTSPVIAIYTRNGGGNRECFCGGDGEGTCIGCRGDQATKHPAYLSDADDEWFDSTYRTYRFRVGNPDVTPDIIATLLEVADDEPRDMSEIWRLALDSISQVLS